MSDSRITWIRGETQPGPGQTIGVLEIRKDGSCRAALAERTEIDGRCHILLARKAWGGKDSLDTRWWSLVLNSDNTVFTIRNGSCGDSVTKEDVPRIKKALENLGLQTDDTMIVVDDAPSVLPWYDFDGPGK